MTRPKRCVIFDLDGTLADTRHRVHHVQQSPKNWKAFFDACGDDPAVPSTVWLWRCIRRFLLADEVMLICSGRPDSHRAQTEAWLTRMGIVHDGLKMRKAGDHRPDTIVKYEMLEDIRASGVTVAFAVDDRPEVTQMWRNNGVPVFQVDDSSWYHDIEDRVSELLHKHVGPGVDVADLARSITKLFGKASS